MEQIIDEGRKAVCRISEFFEHIKYILTGDCRADFMKVMELASKGLGQPAAQPPEASLMHLARLKVSKGVVAAWMANLQDRTMAASLEPYMADLFHATDMLIKMLVEGQGQGQGRGQDFHPFTAAQLQTTREAWKKVNTWLENATLEPTAFEGLMNVKATAKTMANIEHLALWANVELGRLEGIRHLDKILENIKQEGSAAHEKI